MKIDKWLPFCLWAIPDENRLMNNWLFLDYACSMKTYQWPPFCHWTMPDENRSLTTWTMKKLKAFLAHNKYLRSASFNFAKYFYLWKLQCFMKINGHKTIYRNICDFCFCCIWSVLHVIESWISRDNHKVCYIVIK